VVPLDVLLDATAPERVAFELDIYWTVHGGGDPLAYFERHPGRFPLCHVKDRTAAGEMVDVGAGAIDFAALFARAEQAGLRHFFVEHDEPADPLASIAASHDHLRGLAF
jgi:sugar phosphate isomerase/epimerase